MNKQEIPQHVSNYYQELSDGAMDAIMNIAKGLIGLRHPKKAPEFVTCEPVFDRIAKEAGATPENVEWRKPFKPGIQVRKIEFTYCGFDFTIYSS